MKEWIKKILNSTLFKFLSYNFCLPLLIPLVILILIKWIIGEDWLSYITLNSIVQTSSLFLVVSFFTNIGFWSSDKLNEDDYNYCRDNKEGQIALSLILGLLSIFIFVSSFMIEKNHLASLIFSGIIMVLLFVVLWQYWNNPFTMHSGDGDARGKGNEKDSEEAKKMNASEFIVQIRKRLEEKKKKEEEAKNDK